MAKPDRDGAVRHPGSPMRSFAGLVVTLGLLGWIAAGGRTGRGTPAPQPTPPAVSIPEPPPVAEIPARVVAAVPAPPPRVIEPDREAIARAEAAVEASRRERAAAEARVSEAEAAVRAASLEAARDASAGKALAYQVKDPSARIERATNRAAAARWEVDRLKAEVAALAQAPRAKARPLMDQGAVAKPIDGKEFHFEIRGDRVAFIDLEKLTESVKTDARLRMRLGSRGRPMAGVVGPVGDFSMRYEMGPTVPESMSDLLDPREVSYALRGWEIVPEQDLRGETYETTRQPASVFARAIRRLNPSTATITLWIYPEGFPLYRRLREDLHARGFLVAARPLPDGMAIRGSPSGSLSAGQ